MQAYMFPFRQLLSHENNIFVHIIQQQIFYMRVLTLLLTLLMCQPLAAQNAVRETIDLGGEWSFALDPDGTGETQGYPAATLTDKVVLPGTTDTNGKGTPNDNRQETTHLSRYHTYTGAAWYSREVEIPASWQGRSITFTMERTRPTKVWVDGRYVGSDSRISTPQCYDLTQHLGAGRHRITVCVDNGESIPAQVRNSSHACSESTQTNWNGIIGRIELEAADPIHISDIKVYPDPESKSARVKVSVAGADAITDGMALTLAAESFNSPRRHRVKAVGTALERGRSEYEVTLQMGDKALEWSEFSPALYRLTADIEGRDRMQTTFGLRRFEARGTQFAINGQTTFLRGKHDACVFPLTAYTAMDVVSWQRYFRTLREYGINHCRFHSWCPPEACFEAADLEGIYLQAELPIWGSLGSDKRLNDFLTADGTAIQHAYGNHASFVMFALGNEMSGDQKVMNAFVERFRSEDDRHLYAYGSNNFLGSRGHAEGEDFFVSCRNGWADDYSTHTRGSFSFADAEQGGLINNTYPNTSTDFTQAISTCPVPIISHETGQFQIYPDYAQIAKYTGVLAPWNLEEFRRRLRDAGMESQAGDFARASGEWAVRLYRADIEMDLRTRGFGGFQLLDLQDYPGQGSAYVGILDAFMDSKGLITPDAWREFCCETVPLFICESMCWTADKTMYGDIRIAHYSPRSLEGRQVAWRFTRRDGGRAIASGKIRIESAGTGLIDVGSISAQLPASDEAYEVLLTLEIQGTPYRNSYPFWVYPDKGELDIEAESADAGVTITRTLDRATLAALDRGEKVLLMPDRAQCAEATVGGLFQTDYWNYRMFKSICDNMRKEASPGTLGILTDPAHPAFEGFPTDFHTDWQWYAIVKNSYPLILDAMPEGYRPTVQVIDNIERNHRLGLLFEVAVGRGRLLVCMADLRPVAELPEVRQFVRSLLRYMTSDDFVPDTAISAQQLQALFRTQGNDEIKELRNISYD